jgi:hypothetical protein
MVTLSVDEPLWLLWLSQNEKNPFKITEMRRLYGPCRNFPCNVEIFRQSDEPAH